jgi:hypothetical protein
MPQVNTKTTVVRTAASRLESTPATPISLRIRANTKGHWGKPP